MVEELLDNNTKAIHDWPDEHKDVETVPHVNEGERYQAREEFAADRWGFGAQGDVDVSGNRISELAKFWMRTKNSLEQKFVQSVVEPFPHISIFMYPANTFGLVRHFYAIKLPKSNSSSVKYYVLDVEKLSHQISQTEEFEGMEGLN